MDNYDIAPLNPLAIRLGLIIDESDVDGMTINPVGPLATGRTTKGSHLKSKSNLMLTEGLIMQIALLSGEARVRCG